MSETDNSSENSRRRDRHRRHRGRDGRSSGQGNAQGGGQGNAQGGGQSSAQGSRVSSGRPEERRGGGNPRELSARNDDRREKPSREKQERIELPPLPKLPTPVCIKCGEPIQDITSALADKASGEPVHFDCVLSFLQGAENLGPNEKIVYIGQGRFAVMQFENPADTRKFKIIRSIEWENRDTKAEWRHDISGRFSQIK